MEEIERKFLIITGDWKPLTIQSEMIQQGYICSGRDSEVRVRATAQQGFLTIKSRKTNWTRHEWEFPIPVQDAEHLIRIMCPRVLRKRRHIISSRSNWIVDEFLDDNEGLYIAEVELGSANESVEMFGWLGQEVTEDSRFRNVNLIAHPYSTWK